jgi:hypothetical protein
VVRAVIAIVIAASGIVMVPTARAQAPAQESGKRAIRLVISPPPSGIAAPLDAARLRADLEAELGRPVRIAEVASPDTDVLSIIYRAAQRELTVGYVPQSGATVVRTLVAPGTSDEVTALAVLLAGNVARDQARELLGPPARAAGSDEIPPGADRPRARSISMPAALPAVDAPQRSPTTVAVRDESPGVPGALRFRSVVWTGNLTLMNVGLSVSDRSTYALLSASGHVEHQRSMAGPGLAVGARVAVGSLWIQSDVGATYLHGLDAIIPPPPPPDHGGYYTNDRLVTRVRSAAVFSPFKDIELFAGLAYALTTHFTGVVHNENGPEVFGGVQL